MIVETENFLTHEECDWIINHINERYTKAEVLSGEDGHRIADACWLSRKLPMIEDIRNRVSKAVNIPTSHMESFHVIRYKVGGEYKEHVDYFPPEHELAESHLVNGGQRTTTAIMYLNDNFEGGETEFPRMSLKIQPKKGKLVVWKNVDLMNSPMESSLHAGLPVKSGVKYLSTLWIRENEFDDSEKESNIDTDTYDSIKSSNTLTKS